MLTLLVIIPILAAILNGFFKLPARPVALAAVILNMLVGIMTMTVNTETWAKLHQMDKALDLMMVFAPQQIMVILTLIVSLAAVIGTKAPEDGQAMWYNSTLLITAGAMGAFLSNNLIAFFSFHELALIPTFLMIGIYGRGNKRAIAWRATLYLGLGSLVLLAGLILLMLQTDCTTFSQLVLKYSNYSSPLSSPVVPGLLLAGFGALISLFPFHSWAAPAYASAPPPIAMMHAGVLKKFGLYGLFMLAGALPDGYFSYWVPVLLVLLVGNVLWVGFVTINQKRLDLTLGNSSVMHMGYIFLGLAAFIASGAANDSNALAYKGGFILMLGHGLSIALLFLLCGSIERSTGSLEYASLGGLGKKLPKLALFFGMGAMASIGLPGFANFPGELLVFFSGFKGWFDDGSSSLGPVQIATICCLWGLVISAVYMLRAYRNIFQGASTRLSEEASPMDQRDKLSAFILCAALLVIGLYPNIIFNLFYIQQ